MLETANELLLLDKLFVFIQWHSGNKASLWKKLVVISGTHNKQTKREKRKLIKIGFLKMSYWTELPLFFTSNYLVLTHIKSPLWLLLDQGVAISISLKWTSDEYWRHVAAWGWSFGEYGINKRIRFQFLSVVPIA